jgi:hypothetical protein
MFDDVKWTPYNHGMLHHQIADGGDGHQMWRVDASKMKSLGLTKYHAMKTYPVLS